MSKPQSKLQFQSNYNKQPSNMQPNRSNGTWINYKELAAALRQENDKLKSSMEKLQKTQDDTNNRSKILFNENQALLQETQQLNLKLSEFKDVEKIKEDNQKLSKMNTELLEENKKLRETIMNQQLGNPLLNELETLKKANTAYVDYIYSKDCIIGNLTGMINQLQFIIKDKDTKLQQSVVPELLESKKTYEEMEARFIELKKNHEKLAYQYADINAKYEELKKTYWMLFSNYNDVKKLYQETKQELEVAQRCMELYFVSDKAHPSVLGN
jgi:chromosome segregation ATPase